MIEAAIIGRPVFSLLADEFAGTQEGSIHFHHLLPENGGCVRVAATLEEHVEQLSHRLGDPEGARMEIERFVAMFIRPHGLDRRATPIFADTIERLAASPRPRPQTTPLWAPGVWPLILTASTVAAVVDWLRHKPLKPVHRALEKAAHRSKKNVVRTLAVARERVKRRAKLAAKQWLKSVVKPLRTRRS
jgi:hypothetical protein